MSLKLTIDKALENIEKRFCKLKWMKSGKGLPSRVPHRVFFAYSFPYFAWIFPLYPFSPKTQKQLLYIDFAKAFDQIWHDGLLFKSHQMNCPVFNRQKGVAQGSCLGPLLFLLYHCRLPRALPSASHVHLYADDLALIITASPWWSGATFTTY